ncbi:hypothetical protein ACA910_001761 [Epithemia clementina (nom. ined.)]
MLLSANYYSVTAFSKYYFFCSLSSQPVIRMNATVSQDGETTSFTILSDEGDDRRFLRTRTDSGDGGGINYLDLSSEKAAYEQGVPASRITTETGSSNPNESGTSHILLVRECPCAPQIHLSTAKYYCPADLGYCAVPGVYQSIPSEPVCLTVHNDEIFVRSIWPIILIWFALILAFCVCTWAGRNACDYTIATIFPCWNKMLFDALCARQGDIETNNNSCLQTLVNHRRVHIQDRYSGIVGRARMTEDSESANGCEYVFRTRIYKVDHDIPEPKDTNSSKGREAKNTQEDTATDDNDALSEDHHMPSCAICFLTLEEGDRVGAIDCGHVFHVDCLKGWLTRRNVCPLCMQEGIAKPKGPQDRLQPRRIPRAVATADTALGSSAANAGEDGRTRI